MPDGSLGAGLYALAGIIVAAVFVRSRPVRRSPKVPIRSTLTRGITMTDASSSSAASSQRTRSPRFDDSAPSKVRELAPAFDGDERGFKPPHALGAGLTTPTNSPTARSPAVISGLGLKEHPTSKHAPKDGDLRSGTRAGSHDPDEKPDLQVSGFHLTPRPEPTSDLEARSEGRKPPVRHSGRVWRPAPCAIATWRQK
jgi:hypothetical protein